MSSVTVYKYVNPEKVECKFREASHINLNAYKTYDELEEIKYNNVNRQLVPKEVVNYARQNVNSELHKGFEWDDDKAAEEYRLIQARQIIYNIRVTQLKPEDTDTENKVYNVVISPYTHLPGEEGYKSTVEVYQNENDYRKLKEKAYRELLYFQEKYKNIVEFKKVFEAIEDLYI